MAVILARKPAFIKALQDQGIIPDHCTDVVIEARMDDVVRIHYSVLGDERLEAVDWASVLRDSDASVVPPAEPLPQQPPSYRPGTTTRRRPSLNPAAVGLGASG